MLLIKFKCSGSRVEQKSSKEAAGLLTQPSPANLTGWHRSQLPLSFNFLQDALVQRGWSLRLWLQLAGRYLPPKEHNYVYGLQCSLSTPPHFLLPPCVSSGRATSCPLKVQLRAPQPDLLLRSSGCCSVPPDLLGCKSFTCNEALLNLVRAAQTVGVQQCWTIVVARSWFRHTCHPIIFFYLYYFLHCR